MSNTSISKINVLLGCFKTTPALVITSKQTLSRTFHFLQFTSYNATYPPNPLEIYPRTIVHMLTSVRAAENRADSLISWAFPTFTLLWNTPFHTTTCAEIIISRWFMTFPVDILCYCTMMSCYSYLDPALCITCQAHN